MSLLADLLSKNKTGSFHGGSKKPPILDIPPTLSKAHGIPANVRTFNTRYIVLTVVSVAFIALGALAAAKFGMFRSSEQERIALPPRVLTPSTPIKAESVTVAPPQVGLATTATMPPIEQVTKARITLEEPPVPVLQKKKSRPTVVVLNSHHPAHIVERPLQQASRPLREKTVSSLKIDTASRDSLLYAARSAEMAGDWRSALASYRKAQKIDPNNYGIMSNVAAALNNLGVFDEGAQEAERALTKKPNYVPALINAAIGYSSLGNTQKAVRLFTYASALDPGNRSLTINLGILHERTGNLDAALATYRQLADAGDPLALQGMGRVYERKGNRSEAVRAYRQIIASPNTSSTLKKEVKSRIVRLED